MSWTAGDLQRVERRVFDSDRDFLYLRMPQWCPVLVIEGSRRVEGRKS